MNLICEEFQFRTVHKKSKIKSKMSSYSLREVLLIKSETELYQKPQKYS